MQKIARVIALLSLVFLAAPSMLYLAGQMSSDYVRLLMSAATAVWFVSAGVWIWSNHASDRSQVGDKWKTD